MGKEHLPNERCYCLATSPISSEPEIAAVKSALSNCIAAVWSNRDLHINDQHSTIVGKRNTQKGI